MKFKLWDNKNREYINNRHAAIDCEGFLFDVSNDDPIEAEVLYSTGVTDCDRTELYVGDVVEAMRSSARVMNGELFMVIFNEKLRCFGLVRIDSPSIENYMNFYASDGRKIPALCRMMPSVAVQVTTSKKKAFRKKGDISTNMTAQILFCGEK